MDNLILEFQGQSNEISIVVTLINFFICLSFSFILRELFLRFSSVSFNKNSISNNLVILSLIVFVVIIIVKNSLALSLGLVGALSIVRFRTPIKEPTELIYLFLSIALGLGFGSSQTLITAILAICIFIFIYFSRPKNNLSQENEEFNLSLEWENDQLDFNEIESTIKMYSSFVSLDKISIHENKTLAIYSINLLNEESLIKIIQELKQYNISEISYNRLPKVF